ncbi:MAG: hypothetical protein P0Y65_17445 [Candidatus Devosia phytovorans]|uniref:TonB C-terminal domain-containing protein n=1 Tax=Candidatus Devosia phytovorans TaxID=3121372 RepID=A0AAJ6B0X5_9HYPH|nr:hypothetical protein [Devosia sp.]WEK03953.1 MAG: hypothetical protein P0Y65_17445 [Devosia sp.]
MIRHLPILLFLACLSGPAHSQAPVPTPAPPPPVVDQDGIRNHLRQALTACWSVPPSYEGRNVAITINFKGDGTLTEEPDIELDGKSVKKNAVLVQSITRALDRCTPFEGLRDFGLMAHQHFAIQIIFSS